MSRGWCAIVTKAEYEGELGRERTGPGPRVGAAQVQREAARTWFMRGLDQVGARSGPKEGVAWTRHAGS